MASHRRNRKLAGFPQPHEARNIQIRVTPGERCPSPFVSSRVAGKAIQESCWFPDPAFSDWWFILTAGCQEEPLPFWVLRKGTQLVCARCFTDICCPKFVGQQVEHAVVFDRPVNLVGVRGDTYFRLLYSCHFSLTKRSVWICGRTQQPWMKVFLHTKAVAQGKCPEHWDSVVFNRVTDVVVEVSDKRDPAFGRGQLPDGRWANVKKMEVIFSCTNRDQPHELTESDKTLPKSLMRRWAKAIALDVLRVCTSTDWQEDHAGIPGDLVAAAVFNGLNR